MIITRLHIAIALLITLALHGGLAGWLVLPNKDPAPERLKQVVRINLQAVVAETTLNTPAPIPEPISEPISEPVVKPKVEPKSIPKPKPVPKPVIQEPIPEPIVEHTPEIVKTTEIVQEAVQPPVEAKPIPLDAVATAKYEQLLAAWLEKHKKYPKRAKRMRIEGEGMLRIVIDRSGKLQQVTLEQKTGNRLLNEEMIKMAYRADPFPAMSENDPRSSLEFIVPVAFLLR